MFSHGIFVILLVNIVQGFERFNHPSVKEKCTRPGVQCSSDCKAKIFCGGSSEDARILEDCYGENNRTLCIQEENTCRCAEGAECRGNEDNYPVICRGTGIFPSVYDCALSYICLETNKPPEFKCECPSGFYFESGTCVESAAGYQTCCIDPAARALCNQVGQIGTFGGCHLGYYYVCGSDSKGRLMANVFRCELGEIFIDGSCQAAKDYSMNKNNFLPTYDFSCTPYGSS